MHELVIRGGTIVDGTGTPGYTGDLAIDDGRLSAVGERCGRGAREINADGLLITPGWVDIHTHYDGQVTWDPILAPSSCQGSTTILMGNCGVGFAPARPEHRDSLIELMEGVEDIPGSALNEGLGLGLGIVPGLSGRSGAPGADHRRGHPDAASRPAGLRHG